MEKQINAWIYCRVSSHSEIDLLHFQADLLHKYAHEHNFCIIGLTKEVDNGTSLHSNKLSKLIDSIVYGFINTVLVYSKDRLFCNADAYTEFELLCLMHNVSIITYKDGNEY